MLFLLNIDTMTFFSLCCIFPSFFDFSSGLLLYSNFYFKSSVKPVHWVLKFWYCIFNSRISIWLFNFKNLISNSMPKSSALSFITLNILSYFNPISGVLLSVFVVYNCLVIFLLTTRQCIWTNYSDNLRLRIMLYFSMKDANLFLPDF